MECKCLLVDAKVKDYVEDDEGVVDEEIRREEEIHEILSRYCSITAQSKPGIFVMTVNPRVLVEGCSRLSNLCLQMHSNLKQLEKIVHQGVRGLEGHNTESTL